jgi:hypothetical protein
MPSQVLGLIQPMFRAEVRHRTSLKNKADADDDVVVVGVVVFRQRGRCARLSVTQMFLNPTGLTSGRDIYTESFKSHPLTNR